MKPYKYWGYIPQYLINLFLHSIDSNFSALAYIK